MNSEEPKIKYITLGCRVNQAESEALAAFEHSNTKPSGHRPPKNVCIINTCAVTRKAAMQSRQAIRKAVRMNPDATIIVTGCYAQSEPDVIEAIEGVDFVIGQQDKNRIFDIIAESPLPPAGKPLIILEPTRNDRRFHQMPAPASGSRTRPFLKIQDGCNAFCTYCIVPYTRGPSRSLPSDKVLAEYHQLISAGAEEIVLTGIHLGRYGLDLTPTTTFARLLYTLDQQIGRQRIRMSSLEPTEITDELLDIVAASRRICPHFHVPLQSGDEGILKRMGRPYTPDVFAKVIETIHDKFPDAAIGADVLVGFPGETESAFEATYNLIQSLPITYLHVFPFSPRPPAPAAAYPDQVPATVVKQRCNMLQDLGCSKKQAFYAQMAGRTLDLIIEKRLPGRQLKGISSNYIPVLCDDPGNVPVNSRTRCRILSVSDDAVLTGEICRSASLPLRSETVSCSAALDSNIPITDRLNENR